MKNILIIIAFTLLTTFSLIAQEAKPKQKEAAK
jgi:hypothetical protein